MYNFNNNQTITLKKKNKNKKKLLKNIDKQQRSSKRPFNTDLAINLHVGNFSPGMNGLNVKKFL